MKVISALGFIVLLSLFSCSSPHKGKFVPEKNMVLLKIAGTANAIRVDQKAYYSAEVHHSVGTEAKVWSEDENVLELIETYFAYKNPQKEIPDGGDSAVETFIFKGKKPGEAKVRVQTIYRGDVTSDDEIVVTVLRKDQI